MSVKPTKKDIPDNSTQRYLPFSQIRENVVIMKDGSARIIMRCSTINFLLKSSEEQDAIILSFQRFLNSIDFPVQILVRSTKLDIDAYLAKLNDKALKQTNSLLQNQTYEYIEYLKKLIEVAQIMRKEFYIVVPFDHEENKSVRDVSLIGIFKNFWNSINGANNLLKIKDEIRNFSKLKKWLVGRSGSIKTSLENIGIKATPLEKTELIKFLTDYYNPNLDNIMAMKSSPQTYNVL